MFWKKAKRIRDLEHDLSIAQDLVKQQEADIKYWKKRFRRTGYKRMEQIAANQVKTVKVELNPVPFGGYSILNNRFSSEEDMLNRVKEDLVQRLVRGLIEAEMVQFIIKDPDYYVGSEPCVTVGAKLAVVPWEQMTRKIIVETPVIGELS